MKSLFLPAIALPLLLAQVPSRGGATTVGASLTHARAADGSYISWREHVIDDVATGGVDIRGGDGLVMVDLGDGRPEAIAANKGAQNPRESIQPTAISWFDAGSAPLNGAGRIEHELARIPWPINSQQAVLALLDPVLRNGRAKHVSQQRLTAVGV